MLKKIKKPDSERISSSVKNLSVSEIFQILLKNDKVFLQNNSPKYKSFEQVRFSEKPEEYTSEEFWHILRKHRRVKGKPVPMWSEEGWDNEKKKGVVACFSFFELPRFRRFFERFDALAKGNFTHDINSEFFIERGILEESIESSRLEGAAVTISDAKRMIREDISPKTKDEYMITNNYRTMQKIKNEWKDQKLSRKLLLEIHFSLTENTLEQEEYHRFRKDSDKIRIEGNRREIYHIPPGEQFLENAGLYALLRFANDEDDDYMETYFHPLVKAIFLHFYIGYLHPFVDGNGRTARGIFYWYLLKHGYWAIPFFPLSTRIKKSMGQYRDAYLYSEQDDEDLTYFCDYNIRQIDLAMKDFEGHIQDLKKDKRGENKILQKNKDLNPRQIRILRYFSQNPDASTSFQIHQKYHNVSLLTARSDLVKLEKSDFLSRVKSGKRVLFFPTKKVMMLFSD